MNDKFSINALKYRIIAIFIFLAIISLTTSCKLSQRVPSGKLEYFKSKDNLFPAYVYTQEPQITLIQKDDILGIMVSSLNIELNNAINFTNTNILPVSVFSGKIGGGGQTIGYAVDSLGYVNIPFIGKIALSGVSLQKAEEIVTSELIKKIKSPVVNIRFMNHKFSVLGEVVSVGTFNLLDDKTTILDAIALAGDLTIFAKRDSIVMIRNVHNKLEINIINLSDRSVFLSPYFHIRNNDIIYVEPTGQKFVPDRPFKQTPPISVALQRIPLYTSIATFLILIINILK